MEDKPDLNAISPLGLGCWVFNPGTWQGAHDAEMLATMETGLQAGVTHLDTAAGYGSGYSERLVGRFLAGRREQVFLASKAGIESENPQDMLASVRHSLARLGTGFADLYYLHWPRSDMDLRPAMEGLELAQRDGLVRKVGVSNFTTEQMELVSQVRQIDALQIGYNLFWRRPEEDVLPYCRERGIAVVTYGSIAMGILTGKFPRRLNFASGDMRRDGILLFQEPAWSAIWEAVETLKALAAEIDRPLQHLAIRWVLSRPGITSALVGGRNPAQVWENAAALQGEIPARVFERMTAISDETARHIPQAANMYEVS